MYYVTQVKEVSVSIYKIYSHVNLIVFF